MKRGDILKGRVFLVHWKSSESSKYAKKLKKEGWVVEAESQNVMRAFDRIKENKPDAVVIYLNRRPKKGREVGFTLKAIKVTNNLPVVFVNGQENAKKNTRKRVPKAIFSTSKELNETLDKFSKKEE